VPAPSERFTAAIKVAGMITNRAHGFSLTSLVDVIRYHFALDCNTFNFRILVLEFSILHVEVFRALHTESVTHALVIVTGPLVRVSCIQKRTVVVGPATVEECTANFVDWNLV